MNSLSLYDQAGRGPAFFTNKVINRCFVGQTYRLSNINKNFVKLHNINKHIVKNLKENMEKIAKN